MNWKKLGKRLLFPPVWVLILLTLLTAVLLITVFIKGLEQTPVAYGVYALSFYTLCAVCLFCFFVLPKQIHSLKQKALKNPFLSRYLSDAAFRTRSTMYLSLYINLLYVIIHLLSWHTNRSWWFVVLAGYYCILAFLWALLAGYTRSNPLGSNLLREWKRSKSCAFILLSINVFLSGAVLMILYRNRGFDYPGILIYIMALYSFYTTIHAIIDIVKYRRMESPIMSTAKTVSLSAALVSMLNLETAMFAQFGKEMSAQSQRLFIILTGAGVSIAIITLSSLLIVKASKEIRRNQYGK